MEANDIRQREIEAFSYRAAHDLKTPLNAVRGFTYLLHAHYGAAMPDEGRTPLLNLLDNAKKYSACCAQPLIVFEQLATPLGQAFRVHDNGVGFEAEAAAPQLFMPFARFHDAAHFDGHGLGLATCMRIVQHHGGTIWLESRPAEGTSVYFTLPDSAASAPPSRPSR